MDEPTSSLTPAEFDRLVLLIEQLAARGRVDHLRLAQDGRGVPALPARDDPARRPARRRARSDRGRRGGGRRPDGRPHARRRRAPLASNRRRHALGAQPDARRACDRRQLRPAPRRGPRHLGPDRRRTHRAAAPPRRRRSAEFRRRHHGWRAAPGRQRARRDRGRDRPACPRSASATASCRAARSQATSACRRWGASRPPGMVRKRALRDETPGDDAAPRPAAARDRPADPQLQRRQPAEGDHRPLDHGGRARSCSSTSRRAASTSAPRPRSTT